MSGRGTLGRRLRWVGVVAGALWVASGVRAASAEDLFAFAGDADIPDAMASLSAELVYDSPLPEPCRLHILSDLRGHAVFDQATFAAMHRALAVNILGDGRVDGCAVESHQVAQDEVAGFLEQRRASGDTGLALTLTYYRLNAGVTVFASLRSEEGDLLGSSGRFDLPVTPSVGADPSLTADADADEDTADRQPSREAAPVETENDRQDSEASAPRRTAADQDSSETSLRRQIAAEARIETTPSKPFNLRRIQDGTPPSIRTVRVIDAGGQDESLLADLADRFVDELEETEDDASAAAGSEAVDIQLADADEGFERILDNEADIVVTHQPISSADADRFARTYGVNMRSRYAERVVAIASNGATTLGCGISYPKNDMLMSTEDHPSSERIYLYANPSIPSAMRDRFIDFALSAEGQAVVAEHAVDLRLQLSDAGYATWRYQTAGEQEAELQDVRDRFRSLIRTSQRVSSTFRFDFASADLVLDARSEQDLENLIDLVKARDIDARRILLFGFADSSGAAPYNVDLSRSRADAVATRLRLAGIPVPPRNVHGIGEDSPVACNLQRDGERDELGARKNRRVEVWIES